MGYKKDPERGYYLYRSRTSDDGIDEVDSQYRQEL